MGWLLLLAGHARAGHDPCSSRWSKSELQDAGELLKVELQVPRFVRHRGAGKLERAVHPPSHRTYGFGRRRQQTTDLDQDSRIKTKVLFWGG